MQAVSRSIGQTRKIASVLARKALAKRNLRHAQVIALQGELGAGKTAFVQGFAKALGIKSAVRSPTFLLIKSYRLSAISYKLLCHIDCYRIAGPKELLPLGLKAILGDPANIVLVEWAERIRSALPRRRLDIHIDHLNEQSRRLTITERT